MFKRVVLLAMLLFTSSVNAGNDMRYALVIGNSAYHYASPLSNPKNDSADIAKALEALYFETQLLQDASKEQIVAAIAEFLSLLNNKDSVGLVYYAGHGVQFQGDNYLLPVETQLGSEEQIKQQSFNISLLLGGMREAKSATNIIILDACRDNPFKNAAKKGSRSAISNESRGLRNKQLFNLDSGLSRLDAPPNTLIAFATAPGRVAMDGKGKNSPYTTQLIQSMQRSGLTIGEVFRQVRASVVKETQGEQIPWESSSLIEDFYFKPRAYVPMGF